MKLTKLKLKQIIKEEIQKALNENPDDPGLPVPGEVAPAPKEADPRRESSKCQRVTAISPIKAKNSVVYRKRVVQELLVKHPECVGSKVDARGVEKESDYCRQVYNAMAAALKSGSPSFKDPLSNVMKNMTSTPWCARWKAG